MSEAAPLNVVNFRNGQPGNEFLQRTGELIQQAFVHFNTMSDEIKHDIMQYSPHDDGWMRNKILLADFLNKQAYYNVQPKDLLLSCGVSHGLGLLLTILIILIALITLTMAFHMI